MSDDELVKRFRHALKVFGDTPPPVRDIYSQRATWIWNELKVAADTIERLAREKIEAVEASNAALGLQCDAKIYAIKRAEAAESTLTILRAELAGARAAVPDGWKLVPVEPTWEMQRAGARQKCVEQGLDPDERTGTPHVTRAHLVGCGEVYQAMVSAAPLPAPVAEPEWTKLRMLLVSIGQHVEGAGDALESAGIVSNSIENIRIYAREALALLPPPPSLSGDQPSTGDEGAEGRRG